MLYKNFEHDFVERTINNLKWIDTKNSIDKTNKDSTIFYEFTNLINQCLGLILLPSQFSNNAFLKCFPQELKIYEVDDSIVKKLKSDEPKILSNVLRHIRNGIAHGHIQQVIDGSDDITDVIYENLINNSNGNISTMLTTVYEVINLSKWENGNVNLLDLFQKCIEEQNNNVKELKKVSVPPRLHL